MTSPRINHRAPAPGVTLAVTAALLPAIAGMSTARAQCPGAWSPLGTGTSGEHIQTLATPPGGEVIAGGSFSTAGGVPANNVAKWNGSAWSPLAGLPSAARVFALADTSSGDLFAAGASLASPNVPMRRAAGTATWAQFGNAPYVPLAYAIAVMPSGNIAVGGGFPAVVASWNGTAWSLLGGWNGPSSSYVYALAVMANGDLIAGGDFNTDSSGTVFNGLARWNGAAWSPIGGGTNGYVRALLPMPNGDLVIGGSFTTAGGVLARGVARWNGTTWSAFGPGLVGPVRSLAAIPSGGLIAGGEFSSTGVSPAFGSLARWDGHRWWSLGSPSGIVRAVHTTPTGDLLVAGDFLSIGAITANHIARWSPPPSLCPADFNCSTTLEVQDIFDFLNAWFAADPAADFNGNGLAVQDIFDYLNAWFAGC